MKGSEDEKRNTKRHFEVSIYKSTIAPSEDIDVHIMVLELIFIVFSAVILMTADFIYLYNCKV